MKNGIKIIAVLTFVFGGMLGTTQWANHVAATTAVDCGCGQRSCDGRCRLLHRRSQCQTCDTDCGCVECPSCACDICQLEVKESKAKKSCFKVEQKVICIPPIRFPWQQDCPPMTSRTKTINVLKKHSYECPSCEYKWTRVEPIECLPTEVQAASLGANDTNQAAAVTPTALPVVPASGLTLRQENTTGPNVGTGVAPKSNSDVASAPQPKLIPNPTFDPSAETASVPVASAPESAQASTQAVATPVQKSAPAKSTATGWISFNDQPTKVKR